MQDVFFYFALQTGLDQFRVIASVISTVKTSGVEVIQVLCQMLHCIDCAEAM